MFEFSYALKCLIEIQKLPYTSHVNYAVPGDVIVNNPDEPCIPEVAQFIPKGGYALSTLLHRVRNQFRNRYNSGGQII